MSQSDSDQHQFLQGLASHFIISFHFVLFCFISFGFGFLIAEPGAPEEEDLMLNGEQEPTEISQEQQRPSQAPVEEGTQAKQESAEVASACVCVCVIGCWLVD